jgi:hypothetical protein
VTLQFRKVHSLAAGFPKCKEIEQLFEATSGMKTEVDARSKNRLKLILDASEGIRSRALVNPDILGS